MNDNQKIKKKAYEIVIEYEKTRDPTVKIVIYEKDGYDLKSQSDAKAKERHIEVKGCKSDSIGERWLEEKQYKNIKNDPYFYLYFVKKVFSSEPEVMELSAKELQCIEIKKIKHYLFRIKETVACKKWKKII